MGRKADIIRLPQSEIDGRVYASDKPCDCRYCYYWDMRRSDCIRDKCWYLLPLPKNIAESFDDDGRLISDCRICPYGRVSPCIGYCIAKLYREMRDCRAITETEVKTVTKTEIRTAAEIPH